MPFPRKRLLLPSIVALGTALVLAPAHAKETDNFREVDSFAGAYLAGGAAMRDNDFAAAAFYYDKALRFDPANADLMQR